jgi:hypothetical protein
MAKVALVAWGANWTDDQEWLPQTVTRLQSQSPGMVVCHIDARPWCWYDEETRRFDPENSRGRFKVGKGKGKGGPRGMSCESPAVLSDSCSNMDRAGIVKHAEELILSSVDWSWPCRVLIAIACSKGKHRSQAAAAVLARRANSRVSGWL